MIKGDCKRRVIFGKTGSGKTVLAREVVKRIGCDRILYYDSNGHDYKDGVICEGLEQLKSYWRRVADGPFKIVFRSTQPRKDHAEVCQIVMSAGNVIFLVDEMDMYFDKGEPSEEFADLIRRGRHEDIELVGISQRPRQLGEVRSMAHELYVFDTHEPSDLGYYKQSFSEALVDKIKALGEYEYVEAILPYDETKLTIKREAYGKESETSVSERAEVDRPDHLAERDQHLAVLVVHDLRLPDVQLIRRDAGLLGRDRK